MHWSWRVGCCFGIHEVCNCRVELGYLLDEGSVRQFVKRFGAMVHKQARLRVQMHPVSMHIGNEFLHVAFALSCSCSRDLNDGADGLTCLCLIAKHHVVKPLKVCADLVIFEWS